MSDSRAMRRFIDIAYTEWMSEQLVLISRSARIEPYYLPHKFGEIARPHPLHHPCAMILDGAGTDPET